MNIHELYSGIEVTVEDMLNARNNREEHQKKLIQENNCCIVCLTFNIMGPLKVFPLFTQVYDKFKEEFINYCRDNNLLIIKDFEVKENTGYEYYICVNEDAILIKRKLIEVENFEFIGRLLDIDVIDKNGYKISRSDISLEDRSCLICSNPAFICSRSRNHTLKTLIEKELELMQSYLDKCFIIELANIATSSLIYEVNTTPKPGLVDQNNNGAHKDMDLTLFEKSANVLTTYFEEFVRGGIENSSKSLSQVFEASREIGINAEIAMFKETNGINTHKGLIFSLGIITTALAYMYSKRIEYSRISLKEIIQEMCKNLSNDFINIEEKEFKTNGEKIFLKYGIKGIRGEAISGFENILFYSLPLFEKYQKETNDINKSGIIVLLNILSQIDDTNVINRSSFERLKEIQENISTNLEKIELANIEDFVYSLDQSFINENISPGGSADLLALTYFIYLFEKNIN